MLKRIAIAAVACVCFIGACFAQPITAPTGTGWDNTPHVQITATPIIDTGSLAGQVLTWVVAVMGVPLAGAAAGLIVKRLQAMGFDQAEKYRGRIQEIILNGMHIAAREVTASMKGKGEIDLSSLRGSAFGRALDYTITHASPYIKKLGENPRSNEVITALKAQMVKLISDPDVPTPRLLDHRDGSLVRPSRPDEPPFTPAATNPSTS